MAKMKMRGKRKVKTKGPKGKVMTTSLEKFFEPVVRPLRDIKKSPAGKR